MSSENILVPEERVIAREERPWQSLENRNEIASFLAIVEVN